MLNDTCQCIGLGRGRGHAIHAVPGFASFEVLSLSSKACLLQCGGLADRTRSQFPLQKLMELPPLSLHHCVSRLQESVQLFHHQLQYHKQEIRRQGQRRHSFGPEWPMGATPGTVQKLHSSKATKKSRAIRVRLPTAWLALARITVRIRVASPISVMCGKAVCMVRDLVPASMPPRSPE